MNNLIIKKKSFFDHEVKPVDKYYSVTYIKYPDENWYTTNPSSAPVSVREGDAYVCTFTANSGYFFNSDTRWIFETDGVVHSILTDSSFTRNANDTVITITIPNVHDNITIYLWQGIIPFTITKNLTNCTQTIYNAQSGQVWNLPTANPGMSLIIDPPVANVGSTMTSWSVKMGGTTLGTNFTTPITINSVTGNIVITGVATAASVTWTFYDCNGGSILETRTFHVGDLFTAPDILSVHETAYGSGTVYDYRLEAGEVVDILGNATAVYKNCQSPQANGLEYVNFVQGTVSTTKSKSTASYTNGAVLYSGDLQTSSEAVTMSTSDIIVHAAFDPTKDGNCSAIIRSSRGTTTIQAPTSGSYNSTTWGGYYIQTTTSTTASGPNGSYEIVFKFSPEAKDEETNLINAVTLSTNSNSYTYNISYTKTPGYSVTTFSAGSQMPFTSSSNVNSVVYPISTSQVKYLYDNYYFATNKPAGGGSNVDSSQTRLPWITLMDEKSNYRGEDLTYNEVTSLYAVPDEFSSEGFKHGVLTIQFKVPHLGDYPMTKLSLESSDDEIFTSTATQHGLNEIIYALWKGDLQEVFIAMDGNVMDKITQEAVVRISKDRGQWFTIEIFHDFFDIWGFSRPSDLFLSIQCGSLPVSTCVISGLPGDEGDEWIPDRIADCF